jgi:predicted RNA binding protein YcfA (HicA-like mRNA interferase family)
MPKLYSSDEILKVLRKYGFKFISQKGSHAKYVKGNLTVIIPVNKKEIPFGTFKSILKQADINLEDFKAKL